jgi:O-antigen/teichoic acid export membrane protein
LLQKFKEHISSYQVYQLLRYGFMVMVGIFMAKHHFSLSEIGQVEFLLMLLNLVSFYWIGGITNQIMVEANGVEEQDQDIILINCFGTFLSFTLLTSIVLVPIKFFFLPNISNVTFSIFWLLLVIQLPTYFIDIYFLIKQKNSIFNVYILVNFILSGLGIYLGYWLFHTIIGILIGLLFGAIFRISIVIFICTSLSIKQLSISRIKNLVYLSWPIILSIILGGFGDYFDEIWVNIHFDSSHYAIYKYGAKEFPLLFLLTNSLALVLTGAVANNLNTGLSEVYKRTKFIILALYPIMIIAMLFSDRLFPLVFNSYFKESALLFNIFLFVALPRLVFPQAVALGLNMKSSILKASIGELVIHIVLSIIFSYLWGMPGIVLATLIAYSFDKLYLIIVLHKNNIQLKSYHPVNLFLLANALLAITFGIWYVYIY